MKRTKLVLARESIRHLSPRELQHVQGGAYSGAATCACTGFPTVGVCTTSSDPCRQRATSDCSGGGSGTNTVGPISVA